MNNLAQHRSWTFGLHGSVAAAALALAILVVLGVVAAPSAQAQTFTTFDVPGAVAISPLSINTAGIVSGFFVDTSYVDHGFVRAADGVITTFDAPGAGTGTYQGTDAYGINAAGVIAGAYY